MVNFTGMGALGLACENVAMVIGQPWTALWLIFWVITNVSTSFYALELSPGFYHWGVSLTGEDFQFNSLLTLRFLLVCLAIALYSRGIPNSHIRSPFPPRLGFRYPACVVRCQLGTISVVLLLHAVEDDEGKEEIAIEVAVAGRSRSRNRRTFKAWKLCNEGVDNNAFILDVCVEVRSCIEQNRAAFMALDYYPSLQHSVGFFYQIISLVFVTSL